MSGCFYKVIRLAMWLAGWLAGCEIIQMRVIKSGQISQDKILTNCRHDHYHLCTHKLYFLDAFDKIEHTTSDSLLK